MNTKDKKISNAASDRRTYLSPCTEIIKMGTNASMMETWSIPRDGYDAGVANGKKWQGDDLDSWDEENGNDEKNWGSEW
ncbi:hypothetical protein [Hallella colorans]|uniref:hypothetical protein n=1 Tax=Hallella colorans TaxID=1703337 RepID=UPI00248D7D1F|nr:hypothetical protein [Hallella colorans]